MGQNLNRASVHVLLLPCSDGLAIVRLEEGPVEVDISNCPDFELLRESTDFLDALAAPDDNSFSIIADLAVTYLQADMAIVNLVDPDGGLRPGSSDRVVATSIAYREGGKRPSISASDHHNLLDPLNARNAGFDFYAEIPLRSAGGTSFGSLVVLSHEARDASDQELAVLRNLARLIVDGVELRLAVFRHLRAVREAISA